MPSITITPNQATYCSYGAQHNNYSANDWLRCGVQTSTSTRYITLIQFDVSYIPAYSTIQSAVMSLWSFDDGATWRTVTSQYAKRNTSSWSAGSVTYSTKPSTTDSNQAVMTDGEYNKWYQWNVRAIVQEWVNGTPNYGFTVIQTDLTTSRGKCYRKSGTYIPKIDITYSLPVIVNGNAAQSIYVNGVLVQSLVINGVQL